MKPVVAVKVGEEDHGDSPHATQLLRLDPARVAGARAHTRARHPILDSAEYGMPCPRVYPATLVGPGSQLPGFGCR